MDTPRYGTGRSSSIALALLGALTGAAAASACGSDGNNADGDDSATGADSDADADADSGADSDADSSGDSDTDSETASDTGSAAACPAGFPLRDYYGKVAVDVEIGDVSLTFIYDTGAPTSVVDLATPDIVGEPPYTIRVGGKDIAVETIDVFPLELPGIHGVLGTDLLGSYVVTIDYQRNLFWLDEQRDDESLMACRHASGEPTSVPFTMDNHLFVHGAFEKQDGWLLVDSGASLGVVVDSAFAALQAAQPRPYVQGFYTPAALGTFWAKLTRLGSITVSSQAVAGIAARTIPDDMLKVPNFEDGLPFLGVLPSGYLQHFLITIDYAAKELRLDRYKGDDGVEPTGFFPVGVGLEETIEPPVHVQQVLAGSAAEEAGVQIGDELVAISGQPLTETDPYYWAWGLVLPIEGKAVELTLRRDGKELNVSLETRDLLVNP